MLSLLFVVSTLACRELPRASLTYYKLEDHGSWHNYLLEEDHDFLVTPYIKYIREKKNKSTYLHLFQCKKLEKYSITTHVKLETATHTPVTHMKLQKFRLQTTCN
jgi:hypothetical protein